jgi:hypothetical protein
MNFRIESRQQPVVGFGGHNYLALVDENGTTHDEIHGVPSERGRLVHVDEYGMPEVVGAARDVISGSKADVLRLWQRMKSHANELGGTPDTGTRDDDAKAKYGVLTPNSNSFWATVLTLSGFDYRQFEPGSSLRTPGTGIDLSDPVWWVPEHRWPGTTVPGTEPSADPRAPRSP